MRQVQIICKTFYRYRIALAASVARLVGMETSTVLDQYASTGYETVK